MGQCTILIDRKNLCDNNNPGYMSPEEHVKLAGIETGSNKYIHPATHPANMITQDATHRMVTDTEKNTWNGKAPGTHTHPKSQITDFPTSMPANGGNSDTVDGKHASAFALSTHNHPKSQITDFPAALKNPAALTISLNGSSQGAYDGSATKSINITASNVGAAASNHSHAYSAITGKPSTFPPSSHSHAYSSITDRPTGLDSGFVRTGQKSGTTIGKNSTAEGYNTTASGDYCHAEGIYTTASSHYSHAEGSSTTASGQYSHAEGSNAVASDFASHAEGHKTTSSSFASHAEGSGTIAKGPSSHAEGNSTTASGNEAHAEGSDTIASGQDSHAEGIRTTASGINSHAEGSNTIAKGRESHAAGTNTIANDYQYVIGTYNVEKAATGYSNSGDRFIVGAGYANNPKNCFRVGCNNIYGIGAYNTSGADYAEYFEWQDGNPDKQDRVGYFVTLDGDKIKIAQKDDYILGVVSSTPSVIGNSYDDQWFGMELLDDWGRPIMEEYTEPAEYIDHKLKDGTIEHILVRPERSDMRPKINPDYDNTKPYIGRSERTEWAPVGMLGVIRVRDDGTCQVNGYCKVADGGIATASDSGYRVIGRISKSIIKILFR